MLAGYTSMQRTVSLVQVIPEIGAVTLLRGTACVKAALSGPMHRSTSLASATIPRMHTACAFKVANSLERSSLQFFLLFFVGPCGTAFGALE